MTIPSDTDGFWYAVVEYQASSRHIYDRVDHLPQQEGQYRVVCLVAQSEDAWKVTHLLCAVSNGSQTYTVCPAVSVGARGNEAGTLLGEPSH